ncbi:MAG: monooxygenase, FAD-binding [Rhodospirillales bacterium]|nr:monooxygenase, FAD-binding [Rhodospirillales bacterium]
MNDADLLIVGGGPAGMMAGLLFARAGVRTLVVEKHGDFLRDFRGDTVHPATLDLFAELGLLDGLLARKHDEARTLTALVAGRRFTVADFSHLPTARGFIALMPQWEFLDFVSEAAGAYPTFALRMNCEATGALVERGRVVGVTTVTGGRLTARLVIAADGRHSVLRGSAALPLRDLGAPMDVFWFRLPKQRDAENRTTGIFARGCIVALIDRGDYWQCAFVFAKGSADAIRARGIAAFRREILAVAPMLGDAIAAVASWDDVKLLSVALDRLTRWHRPGLLAIGDAAHTMSPIGGVGINLAIQDAVAAANILAAPLAAGDAVDDLLARVQARRMLPTRFIQAVQRTIQTRIIGRLLLDPGAPVSEPPLLLRLLDRVPLLQRIPARIVGIGIRREHIASPEAARH